MKVLTADGFDVTYSHIETGTDFFDIDNLTEYDAVISNPPFSRRNDILHRLFTSGVPFGIIMDFNGIFDNKKRWHLFKDNQFEILVPQGRMKFFNDSCEGRAPQFQSVYVCKNILPEKIVFGSKANVKGD